MRSIFACITAKIIVKSGYFPLFYLVFVDALFPAWPTRENQVTLRCELCNFSQNHVTVTAVK